MNKVPYKKNNPVNIMFDSIRVTLITLTFGCTGTVKKKKHLLVLKSRARPPGVVVATVANRWVDVFLHKAALLHITTLPLLAL